MLVLALAIAAATVGCDNSTTLLVVVDGEAGELDTLELGVSADGAVVFSESFEIGAPATLPQSLLLRPGNLGDASLVITAIGRKGGPRGAEVARGTATASFATGVQTRVIVGLAASCAGVVCPVWAWCAADRCEPRPCDRSADCDDGSACNGAETCVDGSCRTAAPLACDDGVACTLDLCTSDLGGCVALPDHLMCAPGQLCDPEASGCVERTCREAAECDDGWACNGLEACDDGRCVPGEPVICDDGIDCTADLCDPATGSCRFVPQHDRCGADTLCNVPSGGCGELSCSNDRVCDDGVECNGTEHCQGGRCRPEVVASCDDDDPCTMDGCFGERGACVHVLVDADRDGYVSALCGGFDCEDTEPLIGPSITETCDGVDQNCDGRVDEAFECALASTEPCVTTCGTEGERTCGEGCEWESCLAPGETCNGEDDDCDGFVDEDVLSALPANGLRITNAPGSSHGASLVAAGEVFGLAWSDARRGDTEVHFVVLDASGAAVSSELRVTSAAGASEAPSLVWTGSQFLVVWTDQRVGGTEIFAQAIAAPPEVALVGGPVQVTDSLGNSSYGTAAWTGTGVALAWVERAVGDEHVRLKLLDEAGVPTSTARTLTTAGSVASTPDLVWTGTELGLAWTDSAGTLERVLFRRLDGEGAPLGGAVALTAASGSAREPSIAWSGERYLVAWNAGGNVEVATLDAAGATVEGSVLVSESGEASSPAVAWAEPELAVAWIEGAAPAEVAFGRVLAGVLVGSPLVVTTTGLPSRDPDLAPGPNGLVLAWSDSAAGNDEIYSALIGCR